MKHVISPVKTALLTLLVILLSIMTGCAGMHSEESIETGSPQDIIKRELYEFIKTEMKSKNITGLAVSVSDSTGILWTEGFGFANKKEKIQFNSDTVSNIGSVSKLLSATAVMRLAESGKIDIDAPVSAYIPEFSPRESENSTTPITVRMLLNHQSGLESDAFHDFYLGNERPDDYRHSYRRAIDAVNSAGLVREPYSVFSYCNLGFALLGNIIENVQGMDFQKAVRELVFDPAGMNSSSFIRDEAPEGKLAMGYSSGKPTPIPYIRDMPAGSLNSSAADMGLFLQKTLASYKNGEGILKKETIHEMFRHSNENVPSDLDFRTGLTWWIVELKSLPGERILGHGGDLPPYHAIAAVLPERDLAVFIMVNSIDGVGSFSLTEILAKTVRTFTSINGQPPIPEAREKSPVIPAPVQATQNLPGYYASPNGLVEIRSNGDKLKIYAFNRWFDAYYHQDGTLTLGMKLLGLFPLKLPVFDEISISTERVLNTPSLNLRLKGVLISPCIKIEPTTVTPEWMNRSGRYTSIHPEVSPQFTDFKLGLDKKSGFFCLYLKSSDGWSKFPLQTESSTRARIMGIGRSLGSIIEVKTENGQEILSYQNFELQGI